MRAIKILLTAAGFAAWAGTSTATPQAGPPSCRTAGLSISSAGQNGAMGHGVNYFRIRNAVRAPCAVRGWFALRLRRRGRAEPTQIVRATRDFAGRQPLRPVLLAPGGFASFRIVTPHLRGPCVSADAIEVGAPGDRRRRVVPLRGGSLFACPSGKLSLGPVQPRDGARGG